MVKTHHQLTCGWSTAHRKRHVKAKLRDAVGDVDSVEVGGVAVDPAARVRACVVIDLGRDAAVDVVSAVVTAAGLAERLRLELTADRVGVESDRRRPGRVTRHCRHTSYAVCRR